MEGLHHRVWRANKQCYSWCKVSRTNWPTFRWWKIAFSIIKIVNSIWSFYTDRQGFLIKILRKCCVLLSFSVCLITPFLPGTVVLIRLPVRSYRLHKIKLSGLFWFKISCIISVRMSLNNSFFFLFFLFFKYISKTEQNNSGWTMFSILLTK